MCKFDKTTQFVNCLNKFWVYSYSIASETICSTLNIQSYYTNILHFGHPTVAVIINLHRSIKSKIYCRFVTHNYCTCFH